MPLCGCMHTSFALTPGHVESRGYGSQWEVFADQIQQLARRMPWMTVGGNHERDWPDSGDRYGSIFDSGELGSCHTQFFIGTLLTWQRQRCTGDLLFARTHHVLCMERRKASPTLGRTANLNQNHTQVASAACRTRGASRCRRLQARPRPGTPSTSGPSTSCSTTPRCPSTRAARSTGVPCSGRAGAFVNCCR